MEIVSKNKTEVHYKKEQQQIHTYNGSIQLKSGQKLYEYDMEKRELSEVKLEAEKTFDMATGDKTKHTKKIANPNSVYVAAINKKNAMRKVLAMFGFRITKSGKVLSDIKQQHVSPEEFEQMVNNDPNGSMQPLTETETKTETKTEINRQKHFEDDGAYADDEKE